MVWWTLLRRYLCWHRQPRAWNFPQCGLKKGEDWENILVVCLYQDLAVAQGGSNAAKKDLELGILQPSAPQCWGWVIGVRHGTGLCNVGERGRGSGLGKLSTS